MAATPADIAAASRAAVVVTWSDSSIVARSPSARDSLPQPSEGFFDAQADAQTVMTARGALIGTDRRRFAVPVQDLLWPDPTSGLPTYTLVDTGEGVNAPVLAARIEIDLEQELTNLEVFG